MLPGRALAARFARQNETEIVCQDQRLKRSASLCAAEYPGHLRSNQGCITHSGPASGSRTPQSRYFEYVESAAQRKNICRLESERRTQNDYLRLQFACQGRANCLHSGYLGRSRKLFEKEKGRSVEIPL